MYLCRPECKDETCVKGCYKSHTVLLYVMTVGASELSDSCRILAYEVIIKQNFFHAILRSKNSDFTVYTVVRFKYILNPVFTFGHPRVSVFDSVWVKLAGATTFRGLHGQHAIMLALKMINNYSWHLKFDKPLNFHNIRWDRSMILMSLEHSQLFFPHEIYGCTLMIQPAYCDTHCTADVL